MIKVIPHTPTDIRNRPLNISLVQSDDEWYAFCNEIGEMNERLNDGWSVKELLQRADDATGYGYQYVTTFDLQNQMNIIEDSHKYER